MINLNFYFAIGFFLCVLIAAILYAWIFSRKGKDKDLTLDPKFIWFCSICTYTYINTREETISVCPRCGSYNKKI